MSENAFETSFQELRDKLISFAKGQGVLASPIEVADTIILPVSELKIGFGGAGGRGTGEGKCGPGQSGRGDAAGSAGIGNVKVTPTAFVVISGDSVTLESLAEEGGVK